MPNNFSASTNEDASAIFSSVNWVTAVSN